jgi:hypothetical protein
MHALRNGQLEDQENVGVYFIWVYKNSYFWMGGRQYTFGIVSKWWFLAATHLCLQHAVLISSGFFHPNNIWWRIQILQLLTIQFSPLSSYFVLPISKHSSQHFVFWKQSLGTRTSTVTVYSNRRYWQNTSLCWYVVLYSLLAVCQCHRGTIIRAVHTE